MEYCSYLIGLFHREKLNFPLITGFLNVRTELLPLVTIDFPYGKLVKTMMFNIYHLYCIFSCAQENTSNGKY
jgi:hypothetical protein